VQSGVRKALGKGGQAAIPSCAQRRAAGRVLSPTGYSSSKDELCPELVFSCDPKGYP